MATLSLPNAKAHCREVAKAVKLRKAKTVVVAPNIEQIESEGGLDDLLGSILKQADEFGLPVVFALSRKKMGQVSSLSFCQCALVWESVLRRLCCESMPVESTTHSC